MQVSIKIFLTMFVFFTGVNFILITKIQNNPCEESGKLRRRVNITKGSSLEKKAIRRHQISSQYNGNRWKTAQSVQHSSQASSGCLLAASICNQLQIGAPFGQGVNGHGGSAKHVYRGTLMGHDVVVKYPRQDGPDQQNGQKTWPAFKLFKECELMQALEKQDSRSLHCYGICFQHKLSDEDNWKRQPFIITQLVPTLKAPSSDPLSQARRFLQMAELIQRFHQFKPGAIEFFDVAWYHFSLIEGAISAIDMDDIRLWFGNKRSTGTHKTLAAFLTMFNQQALKQCGGVFRTWYHSFRAGNWNETIPNVSASLCDPRAGHLRLGDVE